MLTPCQTDYMGCKPLACFVCKGCLLCSSQKPTDDELTSNYQRLNDRTEHEMLTPCQTDYRGCKPLACFVCEGCLLCSLQKATDDGQPTSQ